MLTAAEAGKLLGMAAKTTELYRHYDEAGRLLYVGISLSTGQRLRGHKARSSWWPLVAKITIERFPSREAALTAEAEAIRTEKPLHNSHHTGPKALPTTYLEARDPEALVKYLRERGRAV